MKIYNGMTGETTYDNGSLDFNLEEKITSNYHPAYKPLYYDQKATSKRLLAVASILAAILFIGATGSYYRLKHETNRLKVMEGLYIAAMDERDSAFKTLRQNETTIASLSAEIKMSRLTSTARKHIVQHPDVVDSIKATYGDEWVDAVQLLSNESSLIVDNVNPSSGACGLPQSLGCEKLTRECTLLDVDCQVKWSKRYVDSRYGSVTKALEFWNNKKATTGSGWY